MISIVTCSRRQSISHELDQNIRNSIGCDYELIVIGNSENEYSIFEAYNIGLRKSKFEIVCFIHDDILFHSKNWGTALIRIFKEIPNAGIVGVAGSKIKLDIPSAWWEHKKHALVKNIIQHRPDGSKETLNFGFNQSEEEVTIVDGVFIGLKGASIKFNEKLQGFHNYDQSICLDYISKCYKVFVTNQILIEHFSNGKIDNSWVNSAHHFHLEYSNMLPINLTNKEISKDEKLRLISQFLFHCKNAGNLKLFIHYWMKFIREQPITRKHFNHLNFVLKFILSKNPGRWN